MSFILDALKKSETDRQQQGTAEFTGIPTSPSSSSVPRWLWVVGLLLAINLIVLIGLLLRPDTALPRQTPVSSGNTAVVSAIEDSSKPSFAEQVAIARQNPPDRQTELPATGMENVARVSVKPVLISQNPSAVPAGEVYPTLQEVRVSGSIDLPELHLDIHVFSPEPDDRFVFINMSKLREGENLSEGPIVSEITPDGVLLRHQGQLFLLPRE